ncbi:MAG: hypothetical protein O3B01_00825 [Planctomycetota bacterium]|nr:hypothetical protein [Planctomycetota bacterium]MDA1137097.1 hypothetical protein [Planctomycetota bacterium]
MDRAFATYRGGKLEFDEDVDWPEGARLEVHLLRDEERGEKRVRSEFLAAMNDTELFGLTEELWPQTEAEREIWLEWFSSIEPLEMELEELNAMEEDRLAAKEIQKEFTRKSWEKIDRIFE